MKAPVKLKTEHINHDCSLIMDAIRRLEEGTWMLIDEDSDYSRYLFPKIRESLNEHVALEEQVLFPKLSFSECQEHRHHHRRLLLQVQMAELALIDGRAEHFQESLRCLAWILNEHHRKFKSPPHDDESVCQCFHGPAERIVARSLFCAL